ncbi:LysR family transcriptional regulator [Acaryochloris sp. IP29b_bin.148]|uniref:LysR family transcriptional regulator n=1 Tax=Acaryochloris sp. IP29b_bin.148 TaxID=2969218 RepID=UPI0026278FB2|nr:LysR family transcriptional regulator [Acaryochloris sp. IP29b_bin.148]
MEIRQLQYFLAVAEELSFGRAAERLLISQPPLSRQIRQLEQELGVELFHRTKRKVELTAAGTAFLPEVRQVLTQAKIAIQVAQRASRGEVGRLVVGFEASSTYDVIPASLKQYRERFPDVDLEVYGMTTEEQFDALLKQRIDIGFMVSPVKDERLSIETILEEPLIVALPEQHPLTAQDQVQIQDLAHEPFITFQRHRGCGLYDRTIVACQQANFSPVVVQEADEMQVILGFVAAGMGIALLSASVQQFQRPKVAYRQLSDAPQVDLSLASRCDNSNAVLQAFIEVVRGCGAVN